MAKKKKPSRTQPVAPAPRPAPAASATATADRLDMAELWRHPTLLLAAISVAFAMISAVLAFKFHDDMSAGALREPTGMAMWAAIAVTLFASYWRERSRERTKSQS